MPQNLTDMTIDEISLVDDGANEDARVVIVKAKSGLPGHAAPGGDDPSNPDAASMAAASIKEFEMDIETLSKALDDAEAKLAALEKRASDAEAALKDAEEVIKAKDEEVAKAKAEAEAKAKGEKSPDGDEDDVMKSLPESLRKRLEQADAIAKAAQEEVTKMKEAQEQAEFIAKAKAMGAGDAEKIGGLLMRVAKGTTTADDAATLETMLKAASEQGKTAALFKALGSDSAVDGEPEAMLKAKADEIQKASDGKLTKEQAYAKAVEENPSLYTAYVSKRRAA